MGDSTDSSATAHGRAAVWRRLYFVRGRGEHVKTAVVTQHQYRQAKQLQQQLQQATTSAITGRYELDVPPVAGQYDTDVLLVVRPDGFEFGTYTQDGYMGLSCEEPSNDDTVARFESVLLMYALDDDIVAPVTVEDIRAVVHPADQAAFERTMSAYRERRAAARSDL